jgi:protein TonB
MSNHSIFEGDTHRASDLNILTLILWTGCLLIGVLGLVLPYGRPRPPQPPPPPIKFETLDIKLFNDPQPSNERRSPVYAQPGVQLQIPQLVPVAQPSPAIAFALPVSVSIQVVDRRQAAYTQPVSTAPTAAQPAPQPLTFGQGEGRQPAPEYPSRAQREGQEGMVTVRLTVAEDGHVLSAEALSSSNWPLLDESAVRAVKNRWHFSRGKFRAYDVLIRFKLAR